MDAYDLQARHAPVVFTILPFAIVAIALVPGLGQMKIAAGTIAFIIMAALPFVATRIARSAGRARQDALYAAWGGMPTTAMLRYRDTRLNPQTKRVFRERLKRLGASFPIPDEDGEQRDPAGADVKIAAAIDEIRRIAKNKGLQRVHRENINYGAARNFYGLKPFGLGICGLASIILAIAIFIRKDFVPTGLDLIVAGAIIIIAAVWIFACTPNRVRQHGEAYTRELFEAIDTVAPSARRHR
jgi:hypothetical protein